MHSQQNACMATSITIRNVPDDTHRELAGRAARSGRSLQEYLRAELVRLAEKPDMAELMERVRERKRAYPVEISSEEIIEFKDADKR